MAEERAGTTQVTGPWAGVFEVDGVDGAPIDLDQIERKSFALNCTIRYTGRHTGLEEKGLSKEVLDDIRYLDPDKDKQNSNEPYTTDLASAATFAEVRGNRIVAATVRVVL